MRYPGPHHRKTDPLEFLHQGQGHRSPIFFSRSVFELPHFHPHFPYCTLSYPIASIKSIPINPTPLLPLRHLKSPHSFPPKDQRWHQRDWPFTRNIFRNQEEHRRTGLMRHPGGKAQGSLVIPVIGSVVGVEGGGVEQNDGNESGTSRSGR